MSLARRIGLISLDFADPGECLTETLRRGLHQLEVFVLRGRDDPVTLAVLERHRRGEVTVHSCSSLAKLAQAEADLPQDVGLIEDCLELAERYGIPNVGFMYGGCATLSRADARQRFLERLAPLADRARGAGIGLLIENVFSREPPGDLDTVTAILDLFADLDPALTRLTFDTGNFAIGGEEAFPYAFHELRQLIGSVHLKDVTRHRPAVHGADDECRPLVDHVRGRHITVPVGDGMLNGLRLAETLLAEPPQFPILLEPFRYGVSRDAWLDTTIARLEGLQEGGADA